MKNIYAVLDIGSATVKLLVGEVVSANINILFSKKITSHGIKKGRIENMPVVVSEIKQLLDSASQALLAPITKVALCIPSFHAHIYQSDGITKVNSPSDRITNEDVIRALKLSQRFERGKDEEIISVIPIGFQLDTRAVLEVQSSVCVCPLPPIPCLECWDYRLVLPHLALFCLFEMVS